MEKIKIYNLEGKVASEKELSSEVFSVEGSPVLIAQAARVQLSNRRNSIAHTKNRGEVSGGGRKPWKQKGTGNARAGSSRSPLWVGGGITFGPRNDRNFALRLPKQVTAKAIKMALTEINNNKRLVVLSDLNLPKISTKQVQNIFEKLPLQEGKILVVLSSINTNAELSMANLPYVKVIKTDNLNLIDLMNTDYVLTTAEAIEKIENTYTGKDK